MKFIWTIAAAVLVLPSVASAKFSVPEKTKPKPRPTQAPAPPSPPPQARRPPHRLPQPYRTPPARPQPQPTPELAGIDPVFVNQTLVGAGYKTAFTNASPQNPPTIATTTGGSAWMVTFRDCGQGQRCGQMEFYTLWPVANEANVCYAWKYAVTNDPEGMDGKPTCYTLPSAGNQLHLMMSSNQPPYTGLNLLAGDKAKSRILAMLGVWTSFVGRLPEAFAYAKAHCPRKTVKCDDNETPKGRMRTRLPSEGALRIN